MHDVLQVLTGRVHRADARRDLLRQLKAEIVDVGQNYGAGPGVTRDGGGHHADRPGTGDQHILAQQVELLRRMHGIAERIENRPYLIGNVVRQFDDVEGRGDDKLCKGTLTVHADAASTGIEMEMAGASRFRIEVDDMALGRDPLADPEAAVDVLANGDDLAGELVASDHGHRDVLLAPLIPVPDVDVGATDGGTVHPDQHVLRSGDRNRRIDQLQAHLGPCLGEGLHRVRHQITPNSRPAVVNAATV